MSIFIENFLISLSVMILVAIFGGLAIRVYTERKKGKLLIEDDPDEKDMGNGTKLISAPETKES